MYTKYRFSYGTAGWRKIDKSVKPEVICTDDALKICDSIYTEDDARLIAAAPEMFEALGRVEAYLMENEDVLAPFPLRSELDSIRSAMFKTGLYKYGK